MIKFFVWTLIIFLSSIAMIKIDEYYYVDIWFYTSVALFITLSTLVIALV